MGACGGRPAAPRDVALREALSEATSARRRRFRPIIRRANRPDAPPRSRDSLGPQPAGRRLETPRRTTLTLLHTSDAVASLSSTASPGHPRSRRLNRRLALLSGRHLHEERTRRDCGSPANGDSSGSKATFPAAVLSRSRRPRLTREPDAKCQCQSGVGLAMDIYLSSARPPELETTRLAGMRRAEAISFVPRLKMKSGG